MVKYSSPPKQNTIRTSGPNPYNYNVGRAGTLLTMMQTGGLASTAGGAALARALQQRSDADALEKYQKAEAKRQGRGSLFGSVGGLAGGLLGAALAPVTGGASLALGAGLGTALGTGLGERLGAGEARDVDRTGTVYGQQSFRDVEDASSEYNKGMLERAGVAGLKAGLTAGLAPSGGMYGKVGGKFRTGAGWSGSAAQQALSIPTTGSIDTSLNVGSLFGDKASIFQPSSYNPMSSLGGPRLSSGSYFSSLAGAQNGGLIGYREGGETSDEGSSGTNIPPSATQYSYLENLLGFDLTPEQEALFQKRDPSDIAQGAQDIGQGLLGMTSATGIMSADTSFGGQQQGIEQALSGAQKSFDQGIEESNKAFASKTAATAADIIARDGEFESIEPEQPPTAAPSSSFPNATWTQQGADGRTYYWNWFEWVRTDG